MIDKLGALSAAPMGPSPSPMPTSAAMSPEDGLDEAPQDAEAESDAELGEIAMAFKEATNPEDAASLLLEFLSQAGFSRA